MLNRGFNKLQAPHTPNMSCVPTFKDSPFKYCSAASDALDLSVKIWWYDVTWAMKNSLVVLGVYRDKNLPSYMGIKKNTFKDPY